MRKRVLLSLLGAVVLVAVGGAAVWFFPVLRVQAIEVTGAAQTGEEAVVAATGITRGQNLMRVDQGGAAAAVTELPWVKRATVARRLPSTIAVDVVEREAVAYRNDPEGPVLVDADGVAFVRGTPPADAVRVGGADDAAGAFIEVAAALDPETRSQVEEVTGPDSLEITLRLRDGRTVYWGASEDNHDKAIATRTVLGQVGEHWDVSNPSLVTVR